MFPDLAFVKFSVVENNGNHIISQRIIPIRYFKQGYRHLKLRNNQNQPMEISSLFIFSRRKIENFEKVISLQTNSNSSFPFFPSTNEINSPSSLIKSKPKQSKILIYGLKGLDDDFGIQVKVSQDTTVFQVIEQALAKIDKNAAINFKETKNYMLIQQNFRKWSNGENQEELISKAILSFKQKQTNSYQHLRTKSLCLLYNNGLPCSYKVNERKKNSFNLIKYGSKNSFSQNKSNKDIKVLQFEEKILDIHNRLGNTEKIIIKEKPAYLVSIFCYFYYFNRALFLNPLRE